jgi:hypothetical protein
MTRAVLALAVLLALPGCSSLKAAADCMARPDAPCPGDDQVRDLDPAAIPDARRLPPHLAPPRAREPEEDI